jgi:flagellar basal body P-ring protein FlgI
MPFRSGQFYESCGYKYQSQYFNIGFDIFLKNAKTRNINMKRPNYQVVKHYSKVIDNLYQKICNKYINAHTCNIKDHVKSVM